MTDETRNTAASWNQWVDRAVEKYSHLAQVARERGETERAQYFEDYVLCLDGQRDPDSKAVTMPP